MATLNTSYGWVAGDVERVLIVCGVGVSKYSIEEVTVCCNDLGLRSSSLVGRVRGLLDEWEDANDAERDGYLDVNGGRVLSKADVLEWDTSYGGITEGAKREKQRISYELRLIFGNCEVIMRSGLQQVTGLYRS
jgi:hypothetical protein